MVGHDVTNLNDKDKARAYLNLDVPGLLDELLNEDHVRIEAGNGLGKRQTVALARFLVVPSEVRGSERVETPKYAS